jgi:hypothetical protein
MEQVSALCLLARKALGRPCGKECVDWAVSMLEQGRDGHSLAILAGMAPPFNHFELARLRDVALQEVDVPVLGKKEAVLAYAAELLRTALASQADLGKCLSVVANLSIEMDYPRELYDFYLLHFAYEDLQESENQWHWEGGTRENIVSIIRRHIEDFLGTGDENH